MQQGLRPVRSLRVRRRGQNRRRLLTEPLGEGGVEPHHDPVAHDRLGVVVRHRVRGSLGETGGAAAAACLDAVVVFVSPHAVGPRRDQNLLAAELGVQHRHGGQVQRLDQPVGGAHVRALDAVNHCQLGRLLREVRLHRGHLEAVDVVPEGLARGVSREAGDVNRRDVGEDRAPRLEHRVPGGDDSVEHGLEEQAVAHPLADQHVIRVGAARDVAVPEELLHLALNDGYPVVDAVVRDVGARARRHRRRAVHADDRGRASPRGEHREDAGAASHVQHLRALDQRGVALESVPVRGGPRDVVEHRAVDVEKSIAAEVILVHGGQRGPAVGSGIRSSRTRLDRDRLRGRPLRLDDAGGEQGGADVRRGFVLGFSGELEHLEPERVVLLDGGAELPGELGGDPGIG